MADSNDVVAAGDNEQFSLLEPIDGVPPYGWRVKCDYECKRKCGPFMVPRLKQIPYFVGLSVRYCVFWLKKYRQKRKPFIDHFNLQPHRPIYGVPIGGIGCGTIGRGYRGEFCRFQLIPGIYKYHTVEANQFIVCIRRNGKTVYQQVLSPRRRKGSALKTWNWEFPKQRATYHGLYPRAWTVYEIPEQNVQIICEQISPVIPHNYQESCLPAAAFIWHVKNRNAEPVEVSITFTFKNGQGSKMDKCGGVWNEPFTADDGTLTGVMIHQSFHEMKCTYAISAAARDGKDVSYLVAFDPNGSGEELWTDLMEDGKLNSLNEPSEPTRKGKEIATAVCCKCSVAGNSTEDLEFSLTWDMPLIHFHSREVTYKRRYTRWFSADGDASPSLSSHTLNNYRDWVKRIEDWQKPVLDNENFPDWYKSALFNELYFVSDGGSVWVDPLNPKDFHLAEGQSIPDVWQDYGKFAYLEGHEYRMFNTYDVHHYASFALIKLWPKLQLSLQYDYSNAILREDTKVIKYQMNGDRSALKLKNTVPHDFGDPEDEPWKKLNAYVVHPTSDWKDLNLKFVLQVFRDYSVTKDEQYLRDLFPQVKAVMEFAKRWDTDNDGIIDNGGFADQTYDAWTVCGASSYCGGLWLAALKMLCTISDILGCSEETQEFAALLDKGKRSFEEKLWNGSYYNYDSSSSGYHDSIMTDQLSGYWFLQASGIEDNTIFPKDHVLSALKMIYENNVMKVSNGRMGAINGMRPNGRKDHSSTQAEEFWCGIIYAAAATMIQQGMVEEGFKTAEGVYRTCWETMGLQYQTPEAYMEGNIYRSLGYMRPLCIWAMQHALEKFHPNLFENQAAE
ncbi:non-lysosomal glucosylceramidase-like [Tubulanus polymorphus]|uniref:non-lysosomal glucosylceramidase-like n=1 Tax=Tubulanus polymorphus TaxID=672921 RepID=UPI003DA34313